MSDTSFKISTYPSAASIEPLHDIYQSTLGRISPYAIPAAKFKTLLTAPRTRVLVATGSSSSSSTSSLSAAEPILGFAITCLIRMGSASNRALQHYKGSLTLLVVDPAYRGQGIGSTLHAAALDHLTEAVQASFSKSEPRATSSQIQLGSTWPRLWPGVPNGPEFADAKAWFERRGWAFQEDCTLDLYRSLDESVTEDEKLKAMVKKVEDLGISFGSPQERDVEGLLKLEREEFDTYTGWPDVFPALLQSGHQQDIWCTFDKDGQVIGATVAALEPEGVMLRGQTWPATLGKKCASMGCVGISSRSRGAGAGIAMVASATMNLARRGADGCFIDWAALKGFYERCGYEPWARSYFGALRTVEA